MQHLRSFFHWFSRKVRLVQVLSAAWIMTWAVPAMAQEQQMPSRGGSLLNVLLLGVIAYFLVRMFRRRMGGGDSHRNDQPTEHDNEKDSQGKVIRPMDRHEAARQMWGRLSSESVESPLSQPDTNDASGFDEADFLEGAKLFFSRYQQAMDSRGVEELRSFMSDEVYRQAMADAEASSSHARTEIMLLNAKLMELKSDQGRTFVTVFFDAQLRRGISGEQPIHLRTVWEFSRDDTVENGLWTLEKINRVDQ